MPGASWCPSLPSQLLSPHTSFLPSDPDTQIKRLCAGKRGIQAGKEGGGPDPDRGAGLGAIPASPLITADSPGPVDGLSTAPRGAGDQKQWVIWTEQAWGERNRSSLQWPCSAQFSFFLEYKASFLLSPLEFRTSYQWQGLILKRFLSHTLNGQDVN